MEKKDLRVNEEEVSTIKTEGEDFSPVMRDESRYAEPEKEVLRISRDEERDSDIKEVSKEAKGFNASYIVAAALIGTAAICASVYTGYTVTEYKYKQVSLSQSLTDDLNQLVSGAVQEYDKFESSVASSLDETNTYTDVRPTTVTSITTVTQPAVEESIVEEAPAPTDYRHFVLTEQSRDSLSEVVDKNLEDTVYEYVKDNDLGYSRDTMPTSLVAYITEYEDAVEIALIDGDDFYTFRRDLPGMNKPSLNLDDPAIKEFERDNFLMFANVITAIFVNPMESVVQDQQYQYDCRGAVYELVISQGGSESEAESAKSKMILIDCNWDNFKVPYNGLIYQVQFDINGEFESATAVSQLSSHNLPYTALISVWN